ncbi:hypothetical protein PHMEG_00028561 [Phytophthora megakarya]|uniref:Tf2-1-like SH3-like domain-containing protein n=1 Tax=Phytophthora megakarya TaxID=4795 RepID=A0A225V4N1_9STRA|nr:hypothetical protein PHMEG_00028561 [Phytophthora megakarya]
MVERQLIKAQDRNAVRLQEQKVVSYDEGDSVWVFQHFRAKRGEKKTKKLAFSWHEPYRVLGQVGENAYRIAIPRHPDKVATVNVNRLKKFKGRWSRPYSDEVHVAPENEEGKGRGVSGAPPVEDGDPLRGEDLPADSYVERVAIGSDETAFKGASSPILDIVAKCVENRSIEYLVLTPTYEAFWLSRSVLSPESDALVKAFENAERKKKNLPELRRSERLEDANAVVDEDELLFEEKHTLRMKGMGGEFLCGKQRVSVREKEEAAIIGRLRGVTMDSALTKNAVEKDLESGPAASRKDKLPKLLELVDETCVDEWRKIDAGGQPVMLITLRQVMDECRLSSASFEQRVDTEA